MEEEAPDGGLCPLLSFIGREFYLYHPNYTLTVPQCPRADSAALTLMVNIWVIYVKLFLIFQISDYLVE